ncbi:hypothetical protein BS329_15815 [Amycolatopsis coloradensis]|uniref:IrrE N-terminal-like domain-containing protein n=1 Tax=Amycolatopsis coloradensis TaxID=76021 RepID=A0A1R0KUE7_9PSEU|nr:hypothetical protein [Amycolatopsis coloradensis]OLZ51728.1 hypothetical protein BS329_15815 [Amycolatopsis coloradensis]
MKGSTGSWWKRLLHYRQVRKAIAYLLREIGAPHPLDTDTVWDLATFCDAVAEHRGRPIELIPYDLPNAGPLGIFQPMQSVDVIIFDRNTTKLHEEQIVLHELGHILLGHKGVDLAGAVSPALAVTLGITPGTDDSGLAAPLHRDTYSDRQELEAEYAASLLSRHFGRRPLAPPRVLRGPDADTVDRLAITLERARIQ